jgi:hypothetical protein
LRRRMQRNHVYTTASHNQPGESRPYYCCISRVVVFSVQSESQLAHVAAAVGVGHDHDDRLY